MTTIVNFPFKVSSRESLLLYVYGTENKNLSILLAQVLADTSYGLYVERLISADITSENKNRHNACENRKSFFISSIITICQI